MEGFIAIASSFAVTLFPAVAALSVATNNGGLVMQEIMLVRNADNLP